MINIKDARLRYVQHRGNSKRRNIPFLISFEEWYDLWEQSGKWEHRGPRQGGYVMSRHNDVGPYAIGNVSIISHEENSGEPGKKSIGRIRSDIPWNKGLKGGKATHNAKKAWETKRKNGTDKPWNKGLKGVQVAWNKGLKKETV
jgi:hypothetical protein